MAEDITIARPYAEAVFALSSEKNALAQWAEMLDLASDVSSDAKMRATLDNPKLAAAAKESLFLSICGDGLNTDGKNFIRVLLQAGRVGLLPDIRGLFNARKDDADGVARARIISAFPVDDVQLANLKVALERRFGKKIEAVVSVDPVLIGGARIFVGDTVIDGSVQGELQSMANQLQA
jgi:F-type H+-transporting ATPase subunit delta